MGGFFYGRYTKEQVERANQVDLEELLLRSGEKLLHSGREKQLESDHSVTIRGNEWYDHAAEEGGFALSFARKHFGLSFQEAMALLLGENGQAPLPKAKPKPAPEPSKPFALPPAAGNQRRVFGYLLGTRQIDRTVLSAFVRKGLVYEDLPYHNAVFVGLDAAGVPRHAHKRSTNSEGKPFRLNVEGSDPAHSFHWVGTSKQLYVFEAPIDLLSYITLHPEGWQQHSYVALCGVSGQALFQRLKDQPDLGEVFLCLDNDQAGHAACKRLTEQLAEQGGCATERLCPQKKDWNDDLTCYSQEEALALMMG